MRKNPIDEELREAAMELLQDDSAAEAVIYVAYGLRVSAAASRAKRERAARSSESVFAGLARSEPALSGQQTAALERIGDVAGRLVGDEAIGHRVQEIVRAALGFDRSDRARLLTEAGVRAGAERFIDHPQEN